MSVTVIKPGMLSSFQDRGREGYQHQGIPAAGAMDERAHRLANALAGNQDDPATLEMTLTGPTLRFDSPACFALAGADLGATLNGRDIPAHRPLIARAGDTLAFGARPAAGVRGYLARAGEVDLLAAVNGLLAAPEGQRDWPLRSYSRERLFSVEARRTFVQPDL